VSFLCLFRRSSILKGLKRTGFSELLEDINHM
jgi:hypothetical protein